MIQRSPTHDRQHRARRSGSIRIYDEGLPTEDCDLLATAMPFPVLTRAYQLRPRRARRSTGRCWTGWRRAASGSTDGEDGTGFQMMYLQRGGGYYFNVGCSDLIVDGAIGLLQFDDIDRFVAEGAAAEGRPRDAGRTAGARHRLQEPAGGRARRCLATPIADRIGPVWGFDEGGELRNMWRPTPQPGLWFIAGSLAQCRIYSKYLALQIKAREVGLLR